MVVVEKLQNFQYKDKNMKDFGENVRHRAKQLAELILDPARVKEERKKVRRLLGSGLLMPRPCVGKYEPSTLFRCFQNSRQCKVVIWSRSCPDRTIGGHCWRSELYFKKCKSHSERLSGSGTYVLIIYTEFQRLCRRPRS